MWISPCSLLYPRCRSNSTITPSVKERVHASDAAHFLIDGQYHFEIGGKGKTRKQIRNLDKAYVVKDDIEVGHENVIPLWMFGFLY